MLRKGVWHFTGLAICLFWAVAFLDAFYLGADAEAYWKGIGMGWLYVVSFVFQAVFPVPFIWHSFTVLGDPQVDAGNRRLALIYAVLLSPIGFAWYIAAFALQFLGIEPYRPW